MEGDNKRTVHWGFHSMMFFDDDEFRGKFDYPISIGGPTAGNEGSPLRTMLNDFAKKWTDHGELPPRPRHEVAEKLRKNS